VDPDAKELSFRVMKEKKKYRGNNQERRGGKDTKLDTVREIFCRHGKGHSKAAKVYQRGAQ